MARPSPAPALAAAGFLALLTGAGGYLASGRPLVGLIGLVGALVAGVAVVILLPSPAAPAPLDSDGQDHGQDHGQDRGRLVQACIYLRDRVTSTALASRLDQTLAEVGVRMVEPTGQRFDPSRHEAGGALPTSDDSLVGVIAAVEAPGYADRGGVLLRPPVVTVYQRRNGS